MSTVVEWHASFISIGKSRSNHKKGFRRGKKTFESLNDLGQSSPMIPMPSFMSPRRPFAAAIYTCVSQSRPCSTHPLLLTPIFRADTGDMKGMLSKDIIGHECKLMLICSVMSDLSDPLGMGIVESVGSNVKNIKVGDRVVVSAPIACGQCECESSSFLVEGKCRMCVGQIARLACSHCVTSPTIPKSWKRSMVIAFVAHSAILISPVR